MAGDRKQDHRKEGRDTGGHVRISGSGAGYLTVRDILGSPAAQQQIKDAARVMSDIRGEPSRPQG